VIIICSGEIYQKGVCEGNNKYENGDLISFEINMFNKSIHFFINEILQPVSCSGIPSSIFFWVLFFLFFFIFLIKCKVWSMCKGDEFEFISLRRIQSSSVLNTTSAPIYNIYSDPDILKSRIIKWLDSQNVPFDR
jgi:hypothetical protein